MQIWSVSLWPPCNLSRNPNCDSDFISRSNPTTVVFSTFLLLATNKNESCRTRRVIQLASGAVRAQVQQTVVTSLPPLTGWGDQSGQMLVWSQRLSGSLSLPGLASLLRVRGEMKLVLESGPALGPWVTRWRVADQECDRRKIFIVKTVFASQRWHLPYKAIE